MSRKALKPDLARERKAHQLELVLWVVGFCTLPAMVLHIFRRRDGRVQLGDLGQQYLDYFAGLKSPPRFFLMMCEMGIRDEEVREEIQAVHQRFVDAATRILAQGMAEGTFREADPIAVAQMLKAMIDGMAGQSAIGIRPDRDRLLGDGLKMLLHGIIAT